MSKIKFFAHNIFSPIFLILIINCIALTGAIQRVIGINEFNNKPAILSFSTLGVACIGISVFAYYMYKRIKEKTILINVARDNISFLFSYISVITGFFYLFMDYNDIMSFVTFMMINLTNIFILLYLNEITKNYKDEFVDNFKLIFMDSDNIKWFLLFSKKMFNLRIIFNNHGVIINHNYIEKSSIKYYEEMFDKKITELNNDELKLIDMHEI